MLSKKEKTIIAVYAGNMYIAYMKAYTGALTIEKQIESPRKQTFLHMLHPEHPDESYNLFLALVQTTHPELLETSIL